MSWILLVTPIVGTIGVVIGTLALRRFLPLDRTAESGDDKAAAAMMPAAAVVAKVVGAAIRDERRKGMEIILEEQTERELERVILGERDRRVRA